jgi:rubrerythrin
MMNAQLAEFLAHSLELESEAHERYSELAESMAAHHNQPVAEFFRRMANEASHHLAEVTEMATGIALPTLSAWEFSWPEAEPPETVSYEALHYRMSLRQAMALALVNERAAESFYREAGKSSKDPETARVAAQFAAEELGHAAELERLMAALPDSPDNLHEEDDDPHMPE